MGWIAFGALAVLNLLVVIVWKPFLHSYATEKGKQLATKEDIDNVLSQVRAVTKETESIRADIQGAVWERQTAWAQKRDIYAALLKTVMELQSSFVKVYSASRPLNAYAAADLDQIFSECGQQSTQLRQHYALGLIFLSREACEAVNAYIEDSGSGATQPHERAANSIEKLEDLRNNLVRVARKDLGLDAAV